MNLLTIDGQVLKKAIISAAKNLLKNQNMLNELNVFPVPDGDTGTNMSLTLNGASKEIEKLNTSNIYDVAKVLANAALREARGNSGVILSQLFRGFAKGLEGKKIANVKDISSAFSKATEMAYNAVMKPKEGTILTIAKSISDKASQLVYKITDIKEFLTQIITHTNEVIKTTVNMLPELKQAGVVDAGGKGLLIILEGVLLQDFEKQQLENKNTFTNKNFNTFKDTEITFGYCTEFFIHFSYFDENMENNLKEFLDSIGDSIVVVSSEDYLKVHVHTNEPLKVLDKALKIGTLDRVKIENMRNQHTSLIDLPNTKHDLSEEKLENNFSNNENLQVEQDLTEDSLEIKQDLNLEAILNEDEKNEINDIFQKINNLREKLQGQENFQQEYGFVAISIGEGIKQLFLEFGVEQIIEGGQTLNPSTKDILNAIEKINAKNIFVLPNNKNIIMAAKQASELCYDKNIIVINSLNIAQGYTALINFMENKSVEENVLNMQKAMNKVYVGQITIAVKDATIDYFNIKTGNFVCMQEDKIVLIENTLKDAAEVLIQKMLNENNFATIVTIYYGADVSINEAEELVNFVEDKFKNVEIELINGGQSIYNYIIAIE